MKTISRGDWAIDILTCCRFEQSETSAGSCILTLIWTDPKVVGVFRARLTGKVLVRGARSKWNRLQPGQGAAELLRPRPAFRKMQGQPACRAGEPSGDREEPPPEGLGGHHLLTRTDARCPAGQVCAITWTASQAALAAKRQGCGIGVPWASWRIPAWADSHNDYCTKLPQYHYTRYTPSSAAGLSLILRMDRSTPAMIRLLTRGDQLVDPLSGVQRRPVRHPAQSVGQLDQRIRRPGRLREYHPRWARGTGCTHSRRQRSGVPPGSRHPSRSS